MMNRKWIYLLLVGLVARLVPAQDPDALLDRLEPQGMVSDYAEVFSPQQKTELENFLHSVKTNTTAQIAVVTLPSLEKGDIVDFSSRLFEKWGIGDAGKDNGVLLITSTTDRKIRIEVGYGLEEQIPDARAGRIIDEHIIPAFRNKKYAEGLTRGAQAIAGIIARHPGASAGNTGSNKTAGQPAVLDSEHENSSVIGPLFIVVFVIVIIVVIVKYGKSTATSSTPEPTRIGEEEPLQQHDDQDDFFGGGESGGGGADRSW
jgi:uncharacterized protein